MRSLNTSLPRSPRRRRSNPPPEQLIQTFKAAALSVTNLYKTAAADQARAREAGYQDALDDVLAFLDKENLGLDDGEGWKVRQWATERLDGGLPAQTASDSDDDQLDHLKRARSSSPVTQRKTVQETEVPRQVSRSASPIRAASAPMVTPIPTERQSTTCPAPETFSFRSTHLYPQDIDMQSDASTNITTHNDQQPPGQMAPPAPAVRVEVVPRGARTPHRGSRHSTRPGTSTRSLGSGAGSKRGFRFGDYEFDIGPTDVREGSGGGGKRGRFV